MDEVTNTIQNLSNNKAVGPDSITNDSLKHASEDIIISLILNFINLNIKNGLVIQVVP